MGASSALRSAHPEDVFETSRLDDREQPEAGSSSGFVRNGGTTREDVEQDDNRDDDEDDAQAGDDTEYFPVSHEIVMKDHTKVQILCLSLLYQLTLGALGCDSARCRSSRCSCHHWRIRL